MQNHWTKDDVAAAWQRFERTYAHDPVALPLPLRSLYSR